MMMQMRGGPGGRGRVATDGDAQTAGDGNVRSSLPRTIGPTPWSCTGRPTLEIVSMISALDDPTAKSPASRSSNCVTPTP